MKKRKVWYIDVGKMSKKEAMKYIDPTGEPRRVDRLNDIVFIVSAIGIIVYIILATL